MDSTAHRAMAGGGYVYVYVYPEIDLLHKQAATLRQTNAWQHASNRLALEQLPVCCIGRIITCEVGRPAAQADERMAACLQLSSISMASCVLQGKDHHLQSVSASSTGDLLRMSQAARSNLEADERMSEVLEASAALAENGDIRLNSHDAELNFQSSSPSAGMPASSHVTNCCKYPLQAGTVTAGAPSKMPMSTT